jgi:hypothetical protein
VPYRLRIDYAYTTVANATTAQGNINAALLEAGRPETCSRNGAALVLQIDGLTEAEAVALSDAMTVRWAVGTRNAGKATVVRRSE